MPLFHRRKPLPLEGLSNDEEIEFDVLCERLSIPNTVVSQGTELANQRLHAYLEKEVSKGSTSELWMLCVLANLYFGEGRLEEAVATCLRATHDYSTDPRAYYALGTVYYGISQWHGIFGKTARVPHGATDMRDAPLAIQELARSVRDFEEQNVQLVEALSKSELAGSYNESANLALAYFRKALACNISNGDKSRIQTHIRIIEVQLGL